MKLSRLRLIRDIYIFQRSLGRLRITEHELSLQINHTGKLTWQCSTMKRTPSLSKIPVVGLVRRSNGIWRSSLEPKISIFPAADEGSMLFSIKINWTAWLSCWNSNNQVGTAPRLYIPNLVVCIRVHALRPYLYSHWCYSTLPQCFRCSQFIYDIWFIGRNRIPVLHRLVSIFHYGAKVTASETL
jgi:hypothetical protein